MNSFKRQVRYYCIFSVIALFFTLWLPILQEEFQYTLRAIAMHQNGDFLNTHFLGSFVARPPLISWLILAITHLVGWSHVLQASRLVTAISTVLTAGVLFKLTQTLTNSSTRAYLSVAVYFSWVVLIKFGWLAYADTLMSLGVILSLYGLWIGVEKRQNRYFILAGLGVIIGFMAKALVPYGIYLVMGFVLLCLHPNRWFLLNPWSILIGLLTLSYLWLWAHVASPAYLPVMWFTLIHGENHYNLLSSLATIPSYLYQVLWVQPVQFVLAIFPLGLMALYRFFSTGLVKKIGQQGYANMSIALVAFLILFIPCWFSWRQWPEVRYYLPMLPLFAVFASYALDNLNPGQKRFGIYGLRFMMVMKILTVIGFYIFYNTWRLDYSGVAKAILQTTQKHSVAMLQKAPCLSGWLLLYGFEKARMEHPHLAYPKVTLDHQNSSQYLVCYAKAPLMPLKRGQVLVHRYGMRYQQERVYLIKNQNDGGPFKNKSR